MSEANCPKCGLPSDRHIHVPDGMFCLQAKLAAATKRANEANETFTAPGGEVWQRPTAEAYYRACQALKSRRQEIDASDSARDEAVSRAEALERAIRSLRDADHYDHWATRLSDSELQAINTCFLLVRHPQEVGDGGEGRCQS